MTKKLDILYWVAVGLFVGFFLGSWIGYLSAEKQINHKAIEAEQAACYDILLDTKAELNHAHTQCKLRLGKWYGKFRDCEADQTQ